MFRVMRKCSLFPFYENSDWVYSDAWGAFVLAVDGTTSSSTTLTVWPGDLSAPAATLELAGTWTEGPGLVHTLSGHAPPSASGNLSVVPIDNLRSVGAEGQPFSWQLAHAGEDWVNTGTPGGNASAAVIYDGALIACDGLPLALVVNGTRLQWAAFPPALHITAAQFPVPASIYYQIPYGASVPLGVTVLGAPGRPAAFLLDGGRLWPVGCTSAIDDNGSNITNVSDAEWDAHPIGPSLFCLHP